MTKEKTEEIELTLTDKIQDAIFDHFCTEELQAEEIGDAFNSLTVILANMLREGGVTKARFLEVMDEVYSVAAESNQESLN